MADKVLRKSKYNPYSGSYLSVKKVPLSKARAAQLVIKSEKNPYTGVRERTATPSRHSTPSLTSSLLNYFSRSRPDLSALTGALKTPRGSEKVTPVSSYKDVLGVQSTNYDPGPNTWDVADIQDFDPNRFETIDVGGKRVTVNAAVADRYKGFLQDLMATGYKIDSLGGQVTRNARGSNRPSLHSYGLAIDINPAQNPMTNRLITDFPSNIRDIAAKYNIVWGGDWRGSKKDAMHFSFPYGGGK